MDRDKLAIDWGRRARIFQIADSKPLPISDRE